MKNKEEVLLKLSNNFQFSIQSDVTQNLDKGYELISKGNDLIKQANLAFSMATNSFNNAVANSDKGIVAKKELGEDTKWYDQHKQMAKDGLAKASKGQNINVV